MPTYAYHCDACETDFEVVQRMSDDPIDVCECGEKGQVRRLIGSGAGLIFKGSGFYITDYKNKGNGSSGESKSESSSASSSTTSSGDCGSPSCCKKD